MASKCLIGIRSFLVVVVVHRKTQQLHIERREIHEDGFPRRNKLGQADNTTPHGIVDVDQLGSKRRTVAGHVNLGRVFHDHGVNVGYGGDFGWALGTYMSAFERPDHCVDRVGIGTIRGDDGSVTQRGRHGIGRALDRRRGIRNQGGMEGPLWPIGGRGVRRAGEQSDRHGRALGELPTPSV
jgi:hypothetical protein